MLEEFSIDFTPQAVGLLGFAMGLAAYLHKQDGRLKGLIGLASFAMAAHFYLLGAPIGAGAALLSGIRSVGSMFGRIKRLAPLFFAAYVPLAFIRVEGVMDVFPIISGVLATYAMFYTGGIRMRAILLAATALWFVHNLLHGSIGGTMLEGFYIAANILTIYRLKKIPPETSSLSPGYTLEKE